MTKVYIASNSDSQRWDRYVSNHPKGIAYQLFAWKDAVEKAYGFKGIYCISEKNNCINGVLPIIHMKRGIFGDSLVSLPYCDAGGPLADTSAVAALLLNKAAVIAGKMGINKVTIRSVIGIEGVDPELTINRSKTRMILKLPSDSKKLLSSLKAKVRSQVKKPMRDGLLIQSGGINLLNTFYDIFSENMRDLGSPVHSKRWVREILKSYNNKSLLFIVRMPDHRPAAGGILLCHPNMISVPWASSLRQFNRWNPNMLLYWGFLKYATDNRFSYIDFGRSTPNQGTYRFKKQWGARPYPLHWAEFIHTNQNLVLIPPNDIGPLGDSQTILREKAEAVIKHMPLTFSKALGNLTRKYISL